VIKNIFAFMGIIFFILILTEVYIYFFITKPSEALKIELRKETSRRAFLRQARIEKEVRKALEDYLETLDREIEETVSVIWKYGDIL